MEGKIEINMMERKIEINIYNKKERMKEKLERKKNRG